MRAVHRIANRIAVVLLIIGVGMGIAGGIYLAWLSDLSARERATPSTARVLILQDGRQIPLVQPTISRPPPAVTDGSSERAPAQPAMLEPQLQNLPPERISIPDIAADWPVVLGTNDSLPQFKGVGWLFGSAFPGNPGNMVLFGHQGGPYGTFMRLHELQPGATFSVTTRDRRYHYRVTRTYETTPDDVSALAPTPTATVTLITCSGPWIETLQTNERRLIVVAEAISDEPISLSSAP